MSTVVVLGIIPAPVSYAYRPDYVEKEKRQPKEWVKDMHWRSVEDEKPPEGTPVMVMAKPKIE